MKPVILKAEFPVEGDSVVVSAVAVEELKVLVGELQTVKLLKNWAIGSRVVPRSTSLTVVGLPLSVNEKPYITIPVCPYTIVVGDMPLPPLPVPITFWPVKVTVGATILNCCPVMVPPAVTVDVPAPPVV